MRSFFDGDYANFANPSRTKTTSFRALLAREDLLLGNATLYSFVRISHQLKFLPADLVTRLTLTQHRALLPLPDPERKQALARRALDEGWSAVVLAQEVRKEVPKSPRGRKPLPPLAKGIHAVARALDMALEGEVASVAVPKLAPEERSALADKVEECLARLEALKKDLKKPQKSLHSRP